MSAVKRLLSAFTAAVAIASVCASCAENESEFTVPHLVETVESVTESSGAEEPVTTESSGAEEPVTTESVGIESTATEAADAESTAVETAGTETPDQIDFSTIPLPGEEGYKDRIRIRNGTYAEYDEGFRDYPLDHLKEYAYAMSYVLRTEYAEELAAEPVIAEFVNSAWELAQGYRPVVFDLVSKGTMILPLPAQTSYPVGTFEDNVCTLYRFIGDAVGLKYSRKRVSDNVYVDAFERTEDDYRAFRMMIDFFDAYYGVGDYPSVQKAFYLLGREIDDALNNPLNQTKYCQFIIEYKGYSNRIVAKYEYDEEKMKFKVTLDSDCYDCIEMLTGNISGVEEPKHHFFAQSEFWFDAASSAQFTLTGVRDKGYAPQSNKVLYILANDSLLPDRAAAIGNAALRSSVESFLGKSSPTVRDLSAIVGVAWTEDTITLTDRRGLSKRYQSGGVCRDAAAFDDFPSLATVLLDASGLPDDVFTRNCFLSTEDLTVVGCKAGDLDLSSLTMLKTLVFRDCPVLRDVTLPECFREPYRFEFSGEKNKYIRTLDFLSCFSVLWNFDIRALSVESVGAFRARADVYVEPNGNEYYPYGTSLVLGDLYDVGFFGYCNNVWDISIYGEAPSDEEILAKIYENEENAKILNRQTATGNFKITIKRY